jgi:hypothetical protein
MEKINWIDHVRDEEVLVKVTKQLDATEYVVLLPQHVSGHQYAPHQENGHLKAEFIY